MTNAEVIDFFLLNGKERFTLKKIKSFTGRKYPYEFIRGWIKYGRIKKEKNVELEKRFLRKIAIYRITKTGENYIRYKSGEYF